MHLIIAGVSYLAAGIFLHMGINTANLLILMLAAVCMASGNYNVKQYKHKNEA